MCEAQPVNRSATRSTTPVLGQEAPPIILRRHHMCSSLSLAGIVNFIGGRYNLSHCESRSSAYTAQTSH
jgi:hypothetical protein